MSRIQANGLPDPPPIDDKNPNKIFQSALMAKLSNPDVLNPIVDELINQAKGGSLKAIAMVRDSIGEKPAPSRTIPDSHITVTFGEGSRGEAHISTEEMSRYGD